MASAITRDILLEERLFFYRERITAVSNLQLFKNSNGEGDNVIKDKPEAFLFITTVTAQTVFPQNCPNFIHPSLRERRVATSEILPFRETCSPIPTAVVLFTACLQSESIEQHRRVR